MLIQDFSKKQTNYWRIMQSSIKVIVTVHLHPPHHSLKHAMLVMLLQGTTLPQYAIVVKKKEKVKTLLLSHLSSREAAPTPKV